MLWPLFSRKQRAVVDTHIMDLEILEGLLQFLGLFLCFFLSSRTTGFTASPSSHCTLLICAVVSAMCFLKSLNPDPRVNGSDNSTPGATQQANSYAFFDKETKRKPSITNDSDCSGGSE